MNGKTIIISGGTKGIGKELAKKCVKLGCNVVISGRDKVAANSIISKIYDGNGNVVFIHADIKNLEDCNRIFEQAFNRFGRIDGFVNYAGITPVASLVDCDEITYDLVMQTNTKAAFFCTQNAIKYMRINRGGSIILVGSAHSWSGQKDRSVYAISKGALYTLSEHISHNYADENIRCNFITMGWTPTEGELELRKKSDMSEKELHTIASASIPMGRMLTPQDHIAAFIYLLSDESSMVTGSNIRVTGGEYI